MSEILKRLAPSDWTSKKEEFSPFARYFRDMDFLVYVTEDVSYRADRIDQFLTLLLHPSEDRAIGVKLKGFRFLFERLRAVLEPLKLDLQESHFFSLVSIVEIAMTAGMGDRIMKDAERQRLENGYDAAKKLIGKFEFPIKDLEDAA